jgi:NADPH-dependent 2,4-dienoyl-CoA reductase/sulfur reductase-like enzyme
MKAQAERKGLRMKLVIVGGVAGGASAAARARRLSEEAEIVLIERGPEVSFANCGLPYYIGGTIADRAKLLVVTPERLNERFKLDVRTRSSVEAIDRKAKKIRIRDLAGGREYDESYDKLILAPGAAPLRPPIPGIELPGIFTLRNLQDTDRIKAGLDQGVRQAVVIGGGFIGLELVENFVRRGIATTVVEKLDQVLPPFDKEMTTPVAQKLAAKGVSLVFGQAAEKFEATADGLVVRPREIRSRRNWSFWVWAFDRRALLRSMPGSTLDRAAGFVSMNIYGPATRIFMPSGMPSK